MYGASKDERLELIRAHKMASGQKIDAVLVYEIPEDEDAEAIFKQSGDPVHGNESSYEKRAKKRHRYEQNLTKAHAKARLIELQNQLATTSDAKQKEDIEAQIAQEEETIENEALVLEHERGHDATTYFTKVHAPFKALCRMAEIIKLYMPLKPTGEGVEEFDEKEPTCFQKHFTFQEDSVVEDYYSAPFKMESLAKFRHSHDPDHFFTAAQRSLLVFHWLQRTRYQPLLKDGSNAHRVGIDRLIENESYTAAFPLHDGEYAEEEVKSSAYPTTLGERHFLYERWAVFANWRSPQPFDRIRNYFGEKVAFYYKFLGFYTLWLVVPAFVGLLVFIIGLTQYDNQTDATELCNSNKTMCALCDTCDNWVLSHACNAYKFSYVFDNGGTVFFATFMAIWATVFLEFWKRDVASTAYDWDVINFKETEPQRPNFKGIGPRRPHPVTGALQRFYPEKYRNRKYVGSFTTLLLMLTLVIWTVLGVIVFRLAVSRSIYENNPEIQESASAITSAVAAVLSLILIIILNYIYDMLAKRLNDWENHETQTNFEFHLTLKIFLFQFVNTYTSIFYIAYFKGQFSGEPGNYHTLFDLRQEECPEYGCLLELTIQLAIIMVGKQAIGNIQEILLPRIMMWWSTRSHDDEAETITVHTPWEHEYKLNAYPQLGMFSQYLEMTIQFGFTTLFVAAFPLAPLFALINNILEIRVDAKTLVVNTRRPFAERAEDIGIWTSILNVVGLLAVITNAFVIAIPSSFIPKLVYRDRNGGSISGYIDASYAKSTVQINGEFCFYKSYRDDTGTLTDLHFEIMMARLAFVIAFEHFVFFVKMVVAYAIPDVPRGIQLQIEREEYQKKVAIDKMHGLRDMSAGFDDEKADS